MGMSCSPSRKLILCASGALLSGSALYVVAPGLWPALLLGGGLFVAWVLLDLANSPEQLDGIRAVVPKRFRLSRHRRGDFVFQLEWQRPRAITCRAAIAFPDVVRCLEPEFLVAADGSEKKISIRVSCRAVKRGLRRIEVVCLETGSRFGFWRIQTRLPADCEVQVFPDVLAERKQLGALFVRGERLGEHSLRQLGKGRDFEKLREYVPGDGYEDIHWKATAKRNKPITKVYQLERTQDIYVVLDASRLSGRLCSARSPDWERTSYLEKNLAVGLMLAQLSERQGDRFGFFAYSDRVRCFLRAASGRAHFNACRDALYPLEPSDATPDFRELLTGIRRRLNRRSLLLFLISLDEALLMESFLENVDLIRRQHLAAVIAIRPQFVRPLFENEAVSSADEIYGELAGHEKWDALVLFQRRLKRLGVDFLMPEADRLGVEAVNQYLTVKKRQIL